MKAWFNFPLMDYRTFICAGAHMSHFWHSVIFMRSVWSPSPSLWQLTTQRSSASSENPIFSLHLTWQILQPSHSLHLNQISISQMPVTSCDMLLNFPTDSTGDLGDSWVFLASNTLLLTGSVQVSCIFKLHPHIYLIPPLKLNIHIQICALFFPAVMLKLIVLYLLSVSSATNSSWPWHHFRLNPK